MGPKARYLGPEVPDEALIWQDPLPEATSEPINAAEIAAPRVRILASDLTVPQLVSTAWASASSFRGSDKRGGANGARIRFEPQRSWEVNNPAQLATVLDALERIRANFNASSVTPVSLADLIVLAGSVAVEKAAKDAGVAVEVPFTPGRVDALEEDSDAASFEWLEPVADGFRNYYGPLASLPAEHHLLDKANLLTLSVPEMTVLIGGLRALDANYDGTQHGGVFTENPGVLSNDFFVKLLHIGTKWTALDPGMHAYQGSDYTTGVPTMIGTSVDLLFGSNSELRAVAEVYASDDAKKKFVEDYVAAWVKVMELDRFDLTQTQTLWGGRVHVTSVRRDRTTAVVRSAVVRSAVVRSAVVRSATVRRRRGRRHWARAGQPARERTQLLSDLALCACTNIILDGHPDDLFGDPATPIGTPAERSLFAWLALVSRVLGHFPRCRRSSEGIVILRYIARIVLCVGVADESQFRARHTDLYEKRHGCLVVVWSQATTIAF